MQHWEFKSRYTLQRCSKKKDGCKENIGQWSMNCNSSQLNIFYDLVIFPYKKWELMLVSILEWLDSNSSCFFASCAGGKLCKKHFKDILKSAVKKCFHMQMFLQFWLHFLKAKCCACRIIFWVKHTAYAK